MTLKNLKPGAHASIVDIDLQNTMRCRLMELGLTPGVKISMVRAAPLGDPIEIALRGYRLTLSKEDASHVRCEALR